MRTLSNLMNTNNHSNNHTNICNHNNNSDNLTVPIIGIHHSPLTQKFGIPRQPNLVDLPTKIEMYAPYNDPLAFAGIEDFSHLWISWQFHQNKPVNNKSKDSFRPQVRPPRLGGNSKLGVFATRSMYRPSGLGLSVVKLDKLEVVDNKVWLKIIGADFIDGTPIIDIKPYIAYSDSIVDASSGFAQDKPTSKAVIISNNAKAEFEQHILSDRLQAEEVDYFCQLIAQDPRPAYRQKELGTAFVMRYAPFDINFSMEKVDSLQAVDATQMMNSEANKLALVIHRVKLLDDVDLN